MKYKFGGYVLPKIIAILILLGPIELSVKRYSSSDEWQYALILLILLGLEIFLILSIFRELKSKIS